MLRSCVQFGNIPEANQFFAYLMQSGKKYDRLQLIFKVEYSFYFFAEMQNKRENTVVLY